jgi:prepilin-type N-terminal cleavage/methylation domain-containing protein
MAQSRDGHWSVSTDVSHVVVEQPPANLDSLCALFGRLSTALAFGHRAASHFWRFHVKQQKGFTLIELMIVVAIIGLIASFALPAYNEHTMKARFAEVNSISNSYKTAVALCYSESNDLTVCDAGSHGIPGPAAATDNLAAGMTVVDGVISMTGTQAAGGWTSVMTPALNGSTLVWTQTGTCLQSGACK